MTHPAPPVPGYIDLRDFEYMPLSVGRLRDSDLVSLETAECFRAAVMLWCAAWHQVPAGSLPNDDRVLSKLAGYGIAVDAWLKVRTGALRGYQLCSDGRLYHTVVAEKAKESWKIKVEGAYRREIGRIKKANERNHTELPVPRFNDWLSSYLASLVVNDTRPVSPTTPENVEATKDERRDDVPGDNGSNRREGNRREGNRNTGITRGGEKTPKPEAPPFDPTTVMGLDLAAWNTWVGYRAERKPAIKPFSMQAAAEALAAFGDQQAAVVKNSMANGYQGLVAPKANGNGQVHAPPRRHREFGK